MELNYQITSSVDSIIAPTDPIDLCVNFFEQKSAVNAQIHLLQPPLSATLSPLPYPFPSPPHSSMGTLSGTALTPPTTVVPYSSGKPHPLASTGNKAAMMPHLKANKVGNWSIFPTCTAVSAPVPFPSPSRLQSTIKPQTPANGTETNRQMTTQPPPNASSSRTPSAPLAGNYVMVKIIAQFLITNKARSTRSSTASASTPGGTSKVCASRSATWWQRIA